MNVDLVTFVMWLLVATTEIHLKTCFCAVFQDLRPLFFQDLFFGPPYCHTHTLISTVGGLPGRYLFVMYLLQTNDQYYKGILITQEHKKFRPQT